MNAATTTKNERKDTSRRDRDRNTHKNQKRKQPHSASNDTESSSENGWSRDPILAHVCRSLKREAIECTGSSCTSHANLNRPSSRNRQRSPFLCFGHRQRGHGVCACQRHRVLSPIIGVQVSSARVKVTPVEASGYQIMATWPSRQRPGEQHKGRTHHLLCRESTCWCDNKFVNASSLRSPYRFALERVRGTPFSISSFGYPSMIPWSPESTSTSSSLTCAPPVMSRPCLASSRNLAVQALGVDRLSVSILSRQSRVGALLPWQLWSILSGSCMALDFECVATLPAVGYAPPPCSSNFSSLQLGKLFDFLSPSS